MYQSLSFGKRTHILYWKCTVSPKATSLKLWSTFLFTAEFNQLNFRQSLQKGNTKVTSMLLQSKDSNDLCKWGDKVFLLGDLPQSLSICVAVLQCVVCPQCGMVDEVNTHQSLFQLSDSLWLCLNSSTSFHCSSWSVCFILFFPRLRGEFAALVGERRGG